LKAWTQALVNETAGRDVDSSMDTDAPAQLIHKLGGEPKLKVSVVHPVSSIVDHNQNHVVDNASYIIASSNSDIKSFSLVITQVLAIIYCVCSVCTLLSAVSPLW